MALIEVLPADAAPATHVLVVGVGAYRHLRGGPGPASESDWGLGQLPGAAASARRFLDWLCADFHNGAAPLASIEHLITGSPGREIGSEEPTADAVSKAFGRWLRRCSSHAGNIALFYFAGHGVLQGTETGLLLADFADPDTPSLRAGAVHVEGTLPGMFRCAADRQCFIIDACRTMEEPLVREMSEPGEVLATATLSQVRPIPQPVLFASGTGQAAYQALDTPSPFTEALIASFDGMGADDSAGGYGPDECVVNTTRLLLGVKRALELQRRRKPFLAVQDAEQAGHGTFDLHYPRKPVVVPLVVGCTPAGLNARARMAVERDGVELASQHGKPGDLHLMVEPDRYQAVASLDGGGPTVSVRCVVTPPGRERRFPFPPP